MSFSNGPIRQIETQDPTLFAFVINGHIDDDASEALAKYMNDAFDKYDKVNMLLDLSGLTGSDWDSMFDGDVIASRFRAINNVARYAVVGAPDAAKRMIAIMDKIIPVDARAYDVSEMDAAWSFVKAKPAA